MNAEDFITQDEFNHIQSCMAKKESFRIERKIKEKGNSYEYSWCSLLSPWYGYMTSCMVSYNYKAEKYIDRNIGGGTYGPTPKANESYTDFCDRFNKHLSNYPDYEEPIAKQLSFF